MPRGFQEVKVPRLRDNSTGWWKVVSLKHRPPLPPVNIPGTHLCWRLSQPQGHSAIGRIMSMKNSNDTSWNSYVMYLYISANIPVNFELSNLCKCG